VAAVGDHEVILSLIDASQDGALVEKHLLGQEQNLLAWVELVNADIDQMGRQIRGLVASRLAERLSLMQQRDDLLASLTIPVRHVEPAVHWRSRCSAPRRSSSRPRRHLPGRPSGG
jgi:hypothetical protein